MKRYRIFGLLIAALSATSCGDNSKICGPGTSDVDGVCTAGPGGGTCGPGTMTDPNGGCVPVCTDGTIADPAGMGCTLDPAACQGGTVLIDGACKDPSEDGIVDLIEGAEPNGLGILGEPSTDPAGVVALKAEGAGAYVLHGSIVPADHDGDGRLDADVDTYSITVDGPRVLRVSADGVHGLVGGFAAVAAVDAADPLASYQRYGLTVTGDTARRDLFLPRAGTYLFTVADTRTILGNAAPVGAAEGAPALEYFVAIDNIAIPAVTPLAFDGSGTATVDDALAGDLHFYGGALGDGFNEATVTLDSTFARASLVNFTNQDFQQYAAGYSTATLAFAEAPGDASIIVVDAIYNYDFNPVPYQLVVHKRDAIALSTTGATAAGPEVTGRATAFYFDVAAADDIVTMNLAFDQAVRAVLVDQNMTVVAPFTAGSTRTITGYVGQLRFREPGRYYFLVSEPAGTGATTLTATSTIAKATVAPIVLGTPASQMTTSSTTFSYDAASATHPWQTWNVSGTGTGAIDAQLLDPAAAYGRLDPLTASGATLPPDPAPLQAHAFPQTGGAVGRILVDDPPTVLVHARPQLQSATTKTVTVAFGDRAFHDFGTLANGMTATLPNEALPAVSNARNLYFVRTAPGARVTIDVDNIAGTSNLAIDVLAPDETATTTNATGLGGDESTVVATHGWAAFAVSGTNVVAGSYNLTISVAAPVAYTQATTSTAFADACTGGTAITPANADDGVTGTIALPAGFSLFGISAVTGVVSTNGFLTVNANATASPLNTDLPDFHDINGVIAPYWDDLTSVQICMKTANNNVTIQWDGIVAATGEAVRFQAILYGFDDAIEFVWDPAAHQARGASATIGIEDRGGGTAVKLGFDSANAITLGMNQKLTPQ